MAKIKLPNQTCSKKAKMQNVAPACHLTPSQSFGLREEFFSVDPPPVCCLPLNAGEEPRDAARGKPVDGSFMRMGGASGAGASQRPAARKRSSECLL